MPALLAERLDPAAARLLEPDMRSPGDPDASPFSAEAHEARENKLAGIVAFDALERTLYLHRDSEPPFITREGIFDLYSGTQYVGENHRRLTPILEEALHYEDTRAQLMGGIDESAWNSTERLIAKANRRNNSLSYDVAIVGSGPHGAAAAMQIREQYPNARILMVDQEGLGGQWRSYGPNAAFWMNSRVRKPNLALPPIPRTLGNINPLGRWAPLELSEGALGNYATNVEMGDVTAVNDYLAVDDELLGFTAEEITDLGGFGFMRVTDKQGNAINVNADLIVDATGIAQESTLRSSEFYRDAPWYFTGSDVYRHFGNYKREQAYSPLAMFNGKDIIVVGGGDSALTALETLLGNLPKESYGRKGVGRNRPNSIIWVGAPGETAAEIDKCLRARYKNGLIQALPKFAGDQGAVIIPVVDRGLAIDSPDGLRPRLLTVGNRKIVGDFLFDCSNAKKGSYGPRIRDESQGYASGTRRAVIKVGPGAKLLLPPRTLEVINRLGIRENTVALWALMNLTDTAVSDAALNINLRTKDRARSRARSRSRPTTGRP